MSNAMATSRKRKNDLPENDLPRSRKHTKTAHHADAVDTVSKKGKTARLPAAPEIVSKGVRLQHQCLQHAAQVSATTKARAQKRKRSDEDDTPQPCTKMRAARAGVPTVQAIVTPQSKRFRNAMPPSPAETPSRKAAKLFDRLQLHGQKPASTVYDTPPATPEGATIDFDDILPSQLRELVALFAALLSAINDQTALNRSDFRINCRELLTATTNIWNKRAVDMDDLRKLLAVLKRQELVWTLEDYGRAGICLIRSHGLENSVNILDTIKLKQCFERELQRQWTQWQRSNSDGVDTFVQQLPLLEVARSDAVDKASSLSSRGKERLSSIRQSQAAAQIVEVQARDPTTKQANVQTRGTNLLDRILAKQAVNATLPAGPTKEQLERQASLQRVEEIVRVLDVLSAGKSRASFSMQSIVQQLQQSLRTPISRTDVERCLSIIAAEIMPHFLSIVASGAMKGIVITRAGRLGLADLRKTLADADI